MGRSNLVNLFGVYSVSSAKLLSASVQLSGSRKGGNEGAEDISVFLETLQRKGEDYLWSGSFRDVVYVCLLRAIHPMGRARVELKK